MAKLPSRTLKIALVASLALNLLIIGAVGGFVGSGRHKDPQVGRSSALELRSDRGQRGGAPNAYLWPILADLDRTERRAFAKGIGQALNDQGLTRQAARDRNEELAAAIRAVPFDAGAVAALFQAQLDDQTAKTGYAHSAVLDLLQDMTPEARESVAKRIIDGRRGKPGGQRRNP